MSGDLDLDDLDDETLLTLDELLPLVQDDVALVEQVGDLLHRDTLELSVRVAEEIDERDLDHVEDDH